MRSIGHAAGSGLDASRSLSLGARRRRTVDIVVRLLDVIHPGRCHSDHGTSLPSIGDLVRPVACIIEVAPIWLEVFVRRLAGCAWCASPSSCRSPQESWLAPCRHFARFDLRGNLGERASASPRDFGGSRGLCLLPSGLSKQAWPSHALSSRTCSSARSAAFWVSPTLAQAWLSHFPSLLIRVLLADEAGVVVVLISVGIGMDLVLLTLIFHDRIINVGLGGT